MHICHRYTGTNRDWVLRSVQKILFDPHCTHTVQKENIDLFKKYVLGISKKDLKGP